ncbi:uncharacterized protein LOC121264361 isoform X2 [Juglans microcarpa x Juglans regia]|uniref:uncharacterized protein LOC121264361 isoform X2 n=1 Tax=Juglans microcarpa x Juglans regia TaxID=2249226 RepID=UPI001B7E59A6|nr:uncharacterized protein LOC121264361 isoform X2 [Juglans microcarpa x Juglans regia]
MSSLCIPNPTLFLFSSSTGALKTLINRARESCLRILSSKMISSKAVTSKKMGKNVGFLVCVFIMVIDSVAGVLGIEAEIIQNKAKHSKVLWMFECREPSYKAFQLGLAAAILLAITHFVAHLFGGCTCIWSKEDYRKSTPNKQLAVVFLLLSWNIGQFKIKKVVWDSTQSNFVYRRDSLLFS